MINVVRRLLAHLPVRIIRKSVINYDRDGLLTYHNSDFQYEPRFNEAFRLGRATGSWGEQDIAWRVHVALWAARIASKIPGDFVECGTHLGGTARAIVEYVDWNSLNKQFHLFDTFAGFDPRWPAALDKDWKYGNTIEQVRRTFGEFDRINLVKGSVPDSLPAAKVDHVAFLHLDMNTAVPERAAVDYFWPRMVQGGLLLLDDYGWKGHEGQKALHDEFAAEHGYTILTLPTGQGLAVKSRSERKV